MKFDHTVCVASEPMAHSWRQNLGVYHKNCILSCFISKLSFSKDALIACTGLSLDVSCSFALPVSSIICAIFACCKLLPFIAHASLTKASDIRCLAVFYSCSLSCILMSYLFFLIGLLLSVHLFLQCRIYSIFCNSLPFPSVTDGINKQLLKLVFFWHNGHCEKTLKNKFIEVLCFIEQILLTWLMAITACEHGSYPEFLLITMHCISHSMHGLMSCLFLF